MKRAPSEKPRTVTLELSPMDVEDVREHGEMNVRSHQCRGDPDYKQPWEWHQGKRMLVLAKRMERALAKAGTGKKRRAAGEETPRA